MQRKTQIDALGAGLLIGLAVLFGFNQVTIKLVNNGFNPVFAAGLRSVIAIVAVLVWMRIKGITLHVVPGTVPVGLAMGAIFAAEFLCIYLALDYTSVTRATVILYSMPVWFALAAHVLLPGERITAQKALGLALAFCGMAAAIFDKGSAPAGASTLVGDLLALGGAIGWACVTFAARAAGARGVSPEMQLLWMVTISAPLLVLAAPLFGDWLRAPGAVSLGALLFQGTVVVAGGFLLWFWLLGRYPASGVASFSFLSPILGLFLGWALLNEPVSALLLGAGALVALGLVLINRPAQVPQKV
jgi:drug/metabolite transporter (DMT)-like permease